ncbi:hypothetical protein ACJJTC_010010 [Scirpophaga incertulas]
MIKTFLVILILSTCCFCLEEVKEIVDESRAKKKKTLLLLLAFSKVAIFKAVTFFLFMGFFQKLFYIGGILLKHFLNKSSKTPPPVYGPPQEYNTVGYSYGPPEHEAFKDHDNLPGIAEVGSSLNWLFHKNA